METNFVINISGYSTLIIDKAVYTDKLTTRNIINTADDSIIYTFPNLTSDTSSPEIWTSENISIDISNYDEIEFVFYGYNDGGSGQNNPKITLTNVIFE